MRRYLPAVLSFLLLTQFFVLETPAPAYEAGAVDNGGTVTGRVVFTGGSVPTRTVLPTKDKDVCGGMREEALVEVGKDNGVVNAVAILKGVTRGKAWGETMGENKITNEKCAFHPHVQVVPVGTDFAIHNSDPMLHNTHGFYGNKTAFNVALPFQGAEVKRKLDTAGIIRVDCDVHGWMRGWIYVADNPYYTLSGEDGAFSIGDVPPGEYSLLIWQENSGEVEKQVSVKAGATEDVGIIEIK